MDDGHYEAWLEVQLQKTDAKVREVKDQLEKLLNDRQRLQIQLDGFRAWRATEASPPVAEIDDHVESQTNDQHDQHASVDGAPVSGPTVEHPTKKKRPSKNQPIHTKTKRASKNQPIFDAFAAAGPAGLTLAEVRGVATAKGLVDDAGAIRALCWSAKQDGRLIAISPGRYAIAPKNEAAVDNPTEEETAASADHNRHREGDAGGGA